MTRFLVIALLFSTTCWADETTLSTEQLHAAFNTCNEWCRRPITEEKFSCWKIPEYAGVCEKIRLEVARRYKSEREELERQKKLEAQKALRAIEELLR